MKSILITAESDDANVLMGGLSKSGMQPVHLPLEQYTYSTDREQHQAVIEQLTDFRFVVYGGMRNARNFLAWVKQSGTLDEFQEKIHLVMNQPEADLLDAAGIPAIMPKAGARAIDIMEFLLRINQDGAVLYPCAEESSEEVPGLLEELGVPVAEFTVCRSVPFRKELVAEKREQVRELKPGIILFHSRGSVIRTRAAFPDLDLKSTILVAASAGVAHKMRQEGLEPSYTASGSWSSVEHLLTTEL